MLMLLSAAGAGQGTDSSELSAYGSCSGSIGSASLGLWPRKGQATQPGLLEAELLLDHPKRMLNFGADVSFGSLDQILQLPFWCMG